MDVQKAMSTVQDQRLAFWFNNGKVVRSLDELSKALKILDPAVFRYHVSKDKNDIYNWILGVFGDDVLAAQIKGELAQAAMARKVEEHLGSLKKPKVTFVPKAPMGNASAQKLSKAPVKKQAGVKLSPAKKPVPAKKKKA